MKEEFYRNLKVTLLIKTATKMSGNDVRIRHVKAAIYTR